MIFLTSKNKKRTVQLGGDKMRNAENGSSNVRNFSVDHSAFYALSIFRIQHFGDITDGSLTSLNVVCFCVVLWCF